MKTKIIIVLASLAAVLAGCGGVIPGVPQEFREYFPYKVGDTLVFSNGIKEEKVCVEYIDAEDEIEYCGYADTQAFVPAEMAFQTDTASLFSFRGGMASYNTPYFNLMLDFVVHEIIGDIHILFEARLENPEENRRVVLESVYVTGQMEKCGMYSGGRIVLEHGKGITSFYDARSNTEWRLKEIIK